MRVRIVVFNGVDEVDFVGPYEVLQRARAHRANADVALATLDGAPCVVGAFGLSIQPSNTLLKGLTC
ncbi:MAG: hypothetical protein HY040_07275 [Planctomycetes bacterium]|nr:hypothetical protein [Planctomycetota bacterium]